MTFTLVSDLHLLDRIIFIWLRVNSVVLHCCLENLKPYNLVSYSNIMVNFVVSMGNLIFILLPDYRLDRMCHGCGNQGLALEEQVCRADPHLH